MSTKKKTNGGFSEIWRRFLVSLKRRPSNIALCALVITFLFYSLHLSTLSNTTAKIQGTGMGLCGFATNLFSMLSFMVFINTFQYRKPVNKVMFGLLMVLFAIIIFADVTYIGAIRTAITRAENPIVVTQATAYIAYADYYLKIHIVLLCITLVLIFTLPLYTKALRKIKTSIEVEDNGSMGAIDISGEA